MKGFICILFFLISTLSYASVKLEKDKKPIKISGSLSLNTNGIAPIPSFSAGKPVTSASLSISKNRFSYDPFFAYTFDLKPWIIDNWFHYKLIMNPKFEWRTGVNISVFFSEYEESEKTILQGQRYNTFELAETYNFSDTESISLLTWYDWGREEGTISGYFICLDANKTDIELGHHFLLDLNLQTFFIDYTDSNDGLFISPTISCSSKDIPAFVFFQGIQPLYNNMNPSAEFSWNVGMGFSF